ncbi:type II toxin-antitoxin system VapC family toxin [Bradyrhizobium yuanmingense]|uniref:type II toxin-antitoxin system VapC family toxin n=1 Tax=Bradyrhizobium yuanmingense TaxID=108015 RepID=UPI0023B9E4B8|nr:type II toxin-antitoxin system VapC family toxin [Bradyrhizobium yuanmingense]MDF0517760.1 type II toxin-antitoxin system VapC family toxin [Bradyrhizobium yuanmingense]
MIAVDTSALMAIVLDEPQADACIAALQTADEILISAATAAESLIVAARRGVYEEMKNLIAHLGLNVISVTQASAERVAQIYSLWGKGNHPAGLNFGDCFAYDIAKENGCALLYVGDDFAMTDIAAIA